jgi:hypothetical protein
MALTWRIPGKPKKESYRPAGISVVLGDPGTGQGFDVREPFGVLDVQVVTDLEAPRPAQRHADDVDRHGGPVGGRVQHRTQAPCPAAVTALSASTGQPI